MALEVDATGVAEVGGLVVRVCKFWMEWQLNFLGHG
jgi:hypothetical protein